MTVNVKSINRIPSVRQERIITGMTAIDRLLGGGFVPGEVVMLAGEPGVGKSTLLLQLSHNLAIRNKKVLYVCGEENLPQVKSRADRLGTLDPKIICTETTSLEDLFSIDKEINADILIVDSLQMLRSIKKKALPGSPTQMRYCLDELQSYIKPTPKVLVIIGHSTKSGMIAGLLTLQHTVDAVFFVSKDEEGGRFIEAKKNRFGDSQEGIGLMMTATGLHELDEEGRIVIDVGTSPEVIAPRELVLPYREIKQAIDGGSWINKFVINNDIKWLYENITGEKLTGQIEYDIICRVKNR
ncbi:MAG: DNA repair protein RadA [Elusimicrobia bacterium]|nr:DNA repair protein RadA [Elusimicrobiota bacterium]